MEALERGIERFCGLTAQVSSGNVYQLPLGLSVAMRTLFNNSSSSASTQEPVPSHKRRPS